MTRLLISVAVGLGGGFTSAFLPIVNAEALVGAGSVGMSVGAALTVACAVALGQTAGKVVIYEAARRGSGSVSRLWRRRSRRRAADCGAIVLGAEAGRVGATDAAASGVPEPDREVADGEGMAADGSPAPEKAKSGRWRRWLQRPWAAGGVVLASASVGVPPLAVVSVAAGIARTPRVLFAVTCITGRILRFGAVAVLVGVNTV
jgi:membrane protein YqaA with SNARE-associated domain